MIFTLVFTNLLLLLVPAVVYVVLRLVCKLFRYKLRYRRFGLFSLVLMLVWTLLLLYGYSFGRFRFEVVEVEYADERVPEAFDGYRIVQISDFHLGGFEGHEAFVDTLASTINSLHPDLICFTGDLVSLNHKEAIPFIRPLRSLQARDGVISVLGNHDYAVYDRTLANNEHRESDLRQLIELQRDSMDWHLLLNKHYTLRHGQDSLCVIGIENQACGVHQVVRRGNLPKAAEGTAGSFCILLSHDPTFWDAEVVEKTDIPLTLSGHTHAMQFRLFGWTPSSWIYRQSDGLYQTSCEHNRTGKNDGKGETSTQKEQTLYVNIGLGELMPFRIGATPEITLITLRKL